jgi:hypothetical protein
MPDTKHLVELARNDRGDRFLLPTKNVIEYVPKEPPEYRFPITVRDRPAVTMIQALLEAKAGFQQPVAPPGLTPIIEFSIPNLHLKCAYCPHFVTERHDLDWLNQHYDLVMLDTQVRVFKASGAAFSLAAATSPSYAK